MAEMEYVVNIDTGLKHYFLFTCFCSNVIYAFLKKSCDVTNLVLKIKGLVKNRVAQITQNLYRFLPRALIKAITILVTGQFKRYIKS